MEKCKIVVTKLPERCTECPFCRWPSNKNLDLVYSHSECSLGSSKDRCRELFFVLEDHQAEQKETTGIIIEATFSPDDGWLVVGKDTFCENCNALLNQYHLDECCPNCRKRILYNKVTWREVE